MTDRGREELRRFMLETEPVRTQRNETGVRRVRMALLDPDDRRTVIERELAFTGEVADNLGGIAERLDAMPDAHPFRATVDPGLCVNAVKRDWLREQRDELR